MKPLVGKTKRHIQNSKDLVDKLQEIVIIEEGEVINSFDITALFTSVLGNEVVQMVIESTTSDPTWNERTLLTPEEFSDLVVETTHFRFQGKIYEQTFNMSMGSPLSSGLSTLLMEFFKEKALKEAFPHPPTYWVRYADDMGVVTKKIHEEELFDHVNKQHPNIKFTIEREDQDNSLPMLDLKVIRTDNRIVTDIYWKPPHTDQYLQWTSHYLIQQKLATV